MGALAAPAALASTASAASKTVWLCRPGLSSNPCLPGLSTTRFSPSSQNLGVEKLKAVKHPAIDCFYVYPTVSDQTTANANLTIDPEERSIALYQAARYSQRCRVFAPMYRQLTVRAIQSMIPPAAAAIAYGDVRAAWMDYLRHDNHGRGVVLIGHSQGSFVLRKLITDVIDPRPAVRRLLVSAILLGGNVTVRTGSDRGGDFKHIGACRSKTQTGCVIAFSTFDAPVPTPALFGRTTLAGQQVLCTNPAALAGGSGKLDTIFPSAPFAPGTLIAAGISLLNVTLPTASTTWIDVPNGYSARCDSTGGANVLQITPLAGAPLFKASPTPAWGTHLVDANIALGNLIELVRTQAAAYAVRVAHGG
jgi:Protein of unknown function (DUF3089)